MGITAHHAIVVTSWSHPTIKQALRKAGELGLDCSGMVESESNVFYTFVVSPDGSNEGWSESDTGDKKRAELIAWMKSQRDHGDGSSALAWVEIKYGSDHQEAIITNHEWLDKQKVRR